jgi:hypothetical protein
MPNLKKLLKRLLGHLPRRSPVGMAEFDAWVTDFKNTYDLPTQDHDSITNVLSTIIINSGPLVTHRSNAFFYKAFVAGAQKEVAGKVFYDLQVRHREKLKAEKESQSASQSN